MIDVSIMPRMISANLNASTLMIADKESDQIRGKSAAAGCARGPAGLIPSPIYLTP